MIAPYTVLLHAVMGTMSLAVFLWVEAISRKGAHRTPLEHYFGFFFFFFAFYNLFLIIPLFFGLSPKFLNLGYALAIMSLFLGGAQAIRVPLAVGPFSGRTKTADALSGAVILICVLATALHLIFPGFAALSESGDFVFWHSYPLAQILTVWGAIGVALTFGLAFLFSIPKLQDKILKIRSFLLALGSLLLGGAAFYYFGANSLFDVIAAFVFSLAGLAAFFFGVIVIDVFRKIA